MQLTCQYYIPLLILGKLLSLDLCQIKKIKKAIMGYSFLNNPFIHAYSQYRDIALLV